MNLREALLNFIFKKQKFIEVLAVFFVFLGVSFKFEFGKIIWVWQSYPHIAILIAGVSIILALIWLKIEKSKIRNTINAIHKKSETSEDYNSLTNRQQQVFDLILQKKSNKEISEELFIELSTLKTHINNIYKALNIKSRKETRRFKN